MQITRPITKRKEEIMSKEDKRVEGVLEVLISFHIAWKELNKTKQKTSRNDYGLFAIAGTVVSHNLMDAKFSSIR